MVIMQTPKASMFHEPLTGKAQSNGKRKKQLKEIEEIWPKSRR